VSSLAQHKPNSPKSNLPLSKSILLGDNLTSYFRGEMGSSGLLALQCNHSTTMLSRPYHLHMQKASAKPTTAPVESYAGRMDWYCFTPLEQRSVSILILTHHVVAQTK